jgi:branched-chain amino acid transport system ATP-binding protein
LPQTTANEERGVVQVAQEVRPGGSSVTAEPALQVRDLSVRYAGAVQALRGVSLSVPEGAVMAVLGGNGAGKTTLLRALSGTLSEHNGAIASGTIESRGRVLPRDDAAAIARSGLVQVPEGRRVFGSLTVEENLRAGGVAAPDKRARAHARAWVDELFPILRERATQRAGLLSGGEQQMLAIGRALMASPQLLLLDEPSLGLAPKIVERVGEVVREINTRGVTVVLVEQNAAMALAVADRAVVLDVGQVALEGTAAELAESEAVRERYLGVTTAAPEKPARRVESAASTLAVEGLSVRFGGLAALSDVSFAVEPGSLHALIGPNGAGKSTCLNVLSGVYAASAGSVRYGDHVLTKLRPHRIAALGVARSFQNIALSPRVSVLDNLLVARHRHMRSGFIADGLRLPKARRERAAHEARVREIAALLELVELERPVGTLSYGTRKRVELARALCAEPELLLLDEPVAGMVHDESEAMARAITQARAELGISVLLVEHDMTFVMGMADRVTVLDFGRRIADGTPAEIRRDPEVLQAYLGGAA